MPFTDRAGEPAPKRRRGEAGRVPFEVPEAELERRRRDMIRVFGSDDSSDEDSERRDMMRDLERSYVSDDVSDSESRRRDMIRERGYVSDDGMPSGASMGGRGALAAGCEDRVDVCSQGTTTT